MARDVKELLDSMIAKIHLIETGEIPNIDLYMDQVTTFMESHLGNLKRNPEDKVLTKTMINNYAKNNLLPSPEKKRYSKEHMVLLTFIYYFKNVLSINDIKTMMEHITKNYFKSKGSPDILDIYDEIVQFEPEILDMVKKDLAEKEKLSDTAFSEEHPDKEYLRKFALLCLLGFDVYIKKQLIESVIDEISAENENGASDKNA